MWITICTGQQPNIITPEANTFSERPLGGKRNASAEAVIIFCFAWIGYMIVNNLLVNN